MFRYSAPMHVRQKFVHAHISKELAKKLGIKRRSIAVRKGDTVKIMAGKNRGKTGKVADVDLGRGTIQVEGVVRKTAKGKEIMLPIRASNVYLTDMDLNDRLRKKKVDQSRVKQVA